MEEKNGRVQLARSLDFMRLGQAVNREQWQAAFMALRRLEQTAKETGCNDFERQFAGVKYAIQRRDKAAAVQVLTLIANRRAQILNAAARETENR